MTKLQHWKQFEIMWAQPCPMGIAVGTLWVQVVFQPMLCIFLIIAYAFSYFTMYFSRKALYKCCFIIVIVLLFLLLVLLLML